MKPDFKTIATIAVLLTCAACDVEENSGAGLPVKTERGAPGKADGNLVPEGWNCSPNYYGTQDGCDCGCGVLDPDCDSDCGYFNPDCNHESRARCNYDWCPESEDSRLENRPGSNENWLCVEVADPWFCDTSHYGTNDGCDCGCYGVDPDCPPDASRSDCDRDHCSSPWTAWSIHPVDVSRCLDPFPDDDDDDDDDGDGGGSGIGGSGCDELEDCGVDERCDYGSSQCESSGESSFSVSRCQASYPDLDCSGSECLGAIHCPVGESCGADHSGSVARRVCEPAVLWDGPGIQPD